ncbi:MAG TPA: hypothetical protein VMT20_11425 [Terriglobia bacterium]|nr:hypothetical protein [Terriglobia bacterium]
MDWKDQLKALWKRATWTRTADFTLPGVLFELQPDFVMAARLAGKGNGDGQGQLGRMVLAPLELDALAPSPSGPAILNKSLLGKTLDRLAIAAGNGKARVGVLVPDGVARVGVFPFEVLPANRREAATLIGWRMRENLPFGPEEARISYQTAKSVEVGKEGEIEVAAVAMRSSVAAEFEEIFESINRSSALILPSTMALLALLPREEAGGQLLVHVCANAATLAVVDRQRLRFWRTRDLAGLAPEQIFIQTAAEAARVVASTEDRLQLRLARTWLCARPPATESWADDLGRTLGRDVELLQPTPETGSLLTSDDRIVYRRYGAPLAGLIANEVLNGRN